MATDIDAGIKNGAIPYGESKALVPAVKKIVNTLLNNQHTSSMHSTKW